jgi:hypothetical protein
LVFGHGSIVVGQALREGDRAGEAGGHFP